MDSSSLDLLPVAVTLCCCCVIVLGGGGAGFFLWRNSQKKSKGVIDVAARPVVTPSPAQTPAQPAAAAPVAPFSASQETVIYKRPVVEPAAPTAEPEAPKAEAPSPFDLPKAGEDVPSASFTEAPTLRWPAPDIEHAPADEPSAPADEPAAPADGPAAEVVEPEAPIAQAEPESAVGGLFGLPAVDAPAEPALPAFEPPAPMADPQQTILHMPRPAMPEQPAIPDLPIAADPNQTLIATPRPASSGRAPDIKARLLALNGADKPYEVSESGFRVMIAPKAITGYLLEISFDFITGSARFTESGPVDDGRIKTDARDVLESGGWSVE